MHLKLLNLAGTKFRHTRLKEVVPTWSAGSLELCDNGCCCNHNSSVCGQLQSSSKSLLLVGYAPPGRKQPVFGAHGSEDVWRVRDATAAWSPRVGGDSPDSSPRFSCGRWLLRVVGGRHGGKDQPQGGDGQ